MKIRWKTTKTCEKGKNKAKTFPTLLMKGACRMAIKTRNNFLKFVHT